jgi:hypothetical protein
MTAYRVVPESGWSLTPGPPARGGSAGIQQPGCPLLPQQACRRRTLISVLETAILSFCGKGASYVPQFEKNARELGCGCSWCSHIAAYATTGRPADLTPALLLIAVVDRSRWRVWETASPGLNTTAGHFVEQDGNGAVISLTLRERGPLAPLVHALLGRQTRRYLAMELEGFRRTAESERG